MSDPKLIYTVEPFGLGSVAESLLRDAAVVSVSRARGDAAGVYEDCLASNIAAVREKLDEIEEWLNMEGPQQNDL